MKILKLMLVGVATMTLFGGLLFWANAPKASEPVKVANVSQPAEEHCPPPVPPVRFTDPAVCEALTMQTQSPVSDLAPTATERPLPRPVATSRCTVCVEEPSPLEDPDRAVRLSANIAEARSNERW